MQLSKVFLIAAALAAANAKVFFTNPSFNGITVGSPFNITWSDASGAVELKLNTGPSNQQSFVKSIASGQTTGSYIWIPDASIATSVYTLEIDDSNGDINYSIQFPIYGGLPISTVSSVVSSSILSGCTANSTIATATGNFANATSTGYSNGTATGTGIIATRTSLPTPIGSAPPTSDAAYLYASSLIVAFMVFTSVLYLN